MKTVYLAIACLVGSFTASCAEPASESDQVERHAPASEGSEVEMIILASDSKVYDHPLDKDALLTPAEEEIPQEILEVGGYAFMERIEGFPGWLRFAARNGDEFRGLVGKYVFNDVEFPNFVTGSATKYLDDSLCSGIFEVYSGASQIPIYDKAWRGTDPVRYIDYTPGLRVRAFGVVPPVSESGKVQINGIGPDEKDKLRFIDSSMLEDCGEDFVAYAGDELDPEGDEFASYDEYQGSDPTPVMTHRACSDFVSFHFDGPGLENSTQIQMSGPRSTYEFSNDKNYVAYSAASGTCVGGAYQFTYTNNAAIIGTKKDIRSYSGRFSIPDDARDCYVNITDGFGTSVNVSC